VKFYFFTSYAAGEDRPWVRRFHSDVERELRIQQGPFVSGRLDLAGADPVGAAATCPAMVALLSDRYSRDLGCGRHWAVFAERIRRHNALRPRSAWGCLVPVRWRPHHRGLPAGLTPPSFPPGADEEPYAGAGLFELMRTHVLGGEGGYYSVIRNVAGMVLSAQQVDLAALPADEAAAIDPAFGDAAERTEAGGGVGGAEPGPIAGQADPPRSVAISYVGADQPWAEWIGNLLRDDGFDVELIRWNAGRSEPLEHAVGRAKDRGDRVIALLSHNFLAPHLQAVVRKQDVDWESALSDAGDNRGRLIRVQIDREPLPPGLRPMRTIQLHDLDDGTIGELLTAVRRRTA
jgi:hypothetical protein